jgi:hypothetical protein
MRIVFGIVAVSLLALAVCGDLLAPATVLKLIDSIPLDTPVTAHIASLVPVIVGNQSMGEIALTCFTIIAVKYVISYVQQL